MGTAATPGLLCQPRVIMKMIMESIRNVDWQGKPKFSEKTCLSATFVHHKIPRAHPGLNPGRRGGKFSLLPTPETANEILTSLMNYIAYIRYIHYIIYKITISVACSTLLTPYVYDSFNGDMPEKTYRPTSLCITVTMMFITDTGLQYILTRWCSVFNRAWILRGRVGEVWIWSRKNLQDYPV
jgi:hypothetical protein